MTTPTERRIIQERRAAKSGGILVPILEKRCPHCRRTKPVAHFHKRQGSKDGLQFQCKECKRSYVKKRDSAVVRVYNRRHRLGTVYGISLEQYQEMFTAQGGRCAMPSCRRKPPEHGSLDVDHCHVTGEVRGLLCNPCNRALGIYESRRADFEEYLDNTY